MFPKNLTTPASLNYNAQHYLKTSVMRRLSAAPPGTLRILRFAPGHRCISTSPQNLFIATSAVQRVPRKGGKKGRSKSGLDSGLVPQQQFVFERKLKREKNSQENQEDDENDDDLPLSSEPRRPYTGPHSVFRKTVFEKLQIVISELRKEKFAIVGISDIKLAREAELFMDNVDQSLMLADKRVTSRERNPLFWNLRDAFIQKDIRGLRNEIKYSFQSFMARDRFSKKQTSLQKNLLDFRFPQEWLPGTRQLQRKVHVHVGPTNSGKTYNAIKALENSTSGVYAGPLRLLATEVYQRLTAKGFPCALITGEEVRQPPDTDQFFTSCTVEMMPLNTRFDVAVIDEIQMLSDPERGSAWTMALLGVQAKEVHVCGEERAVDLIQALCASLGDECIVHRYERLSPLDTMSKALGSNLNKLEKGDAVVSFNRMNLHTMKRDIEKYTGRRCAIIYGTLPPEVRVQQAALFNDPNNDYDFIVASDAIGMGLNLEIRRVILESVTKYDGHQNRLLTYPEIKQIGGRAGRFRSATNPNGGVVGEGSTSENAGGFVTAMEQDDMHLIKRAFTKEVPNLTVAYLNPPAGVVERFASYYPPGTPLSFILQRIRMAASLSERFRISITDDVLAISDIVHEFNMPIWDKLTFCYMPVRLRDSNSTKVIRALARVVANNEPGDLLSIKEIPLEHLDIDMSDMGGTNGHLYLQKMESLHDAINQYVWLSYRYTGMFRDRDLAFHVRELVGDRLIDLLDRLNFTGQDLGRMRKKGRLQAVSRQVERKTLGEAIDSEGEALQDLVEVSKSALVG